MQMSHFKGATEPQGGSSSAPAYQAGFIEEEMKLDRRQTVIRVADLDEFPKPVVEPPAKEASDDSHEENHN